MSRLWQMLWLTVLLGALAAGTHGAETRAVIVAGLGGTADYEAEFRRHAERIAKGLEQVGDDVTLLSGEAANTEAVRRAVAGLASRSQSDEKLYFVFIGHGTYNREVFKFNVPGPDFSATELQSWLTPAAAKHQLVVVTGSSSGAVQDVLAADGRTVISGTRSGEQRNATVFGGYFSAALSDEAADLDKDGRITADEAFGFAERAVDDYYSGNQEMSTENPLLESPQPLLVLAHLDAQVTVDPDLGYLLSRRDALENEVATLRENKTQYGTDEYLAELQRLLLELAVIDAQLNDAGAGNQ